MQLKKYQQNALETLEVYLKELRRDGPKRAFNYVTPDEASKYKEGGFGQIPFVCVKIPTGGGKTLVAAHAVEKIMSIALQEKLDKGLVLWFTPSDAIQTQTLKKFKDRKDWHRRVLDEAFSNNVKVFSNQEALSITKGDIDDNLCIIVASVDAFRKDKTKQSKYKVFQENGALLEHFQNIEGFDFLEYDSEGTIVTSLANVIRLSAPLIVIDEGHHTQTELSFDLLKSLNPSFVVEYTATPRGGSNVLIDVAASELKAEHMVKIPLVLENVSHWENAIEEAVAQRNALEKTTKKLKSGYIRPIVLLQAQSDRGEESITVDKVKSFLLGKGIKEDEVAIKISGKDELEGKDLLSKKCPIKYIITINALAEGWDCSFAYILVSVANIGAPVQVEQIIGRIMRMPNAKKSEFEELNRSYVFASARNFQDAADRVIKSLQSHGYSKADVIAASKTVKRDESEVGKAIKADLKVPLIAFKNEKLAWEDLVEDFELANQNHKFSFKAHYDSDGRAIIDINEDNEWSESKQAKLNLEYHDKNFSKSELMQWLDKKLRLPILEKSDKVKFLEKAVAHLLVQKDINLTTLSVNRYVLVDRLSEVINDLLQEHAKMVFETGLKKKYLSTKTFDSYPDTLFLKQPVPKEFNKNLYERIDPLNGEEADFARRLDLLENIKFWVRNREKVDPFYIQGWKKGKFYPDFVAVSKKGTIVALEWKGGDRIDNPDTLYKEEVASIWEKLSKGKLHFLLVHNGNIEEVLTELEAI